MIKHLQHIGMGKFLTSGWVLKGIALVVISVFCLGVGTQPVSAQEYAFGDLGKPADYDVTIRDFQRVMPDFLTRTRSLPSSFDWRSHGVVSVAKNQGLCGSCWAFASVGVMESKIAMSKGGALHDLSEQQLVSCDSSGNGCCGGYMSSLRFWENKGPQLENCTGYADASRTACGSNKTCSDLGGCSEIHYRSAGYYTVNTTSIADMKMSLYTHGPAAFRYDVWSDFSYNGSGWWHSASSGSVYRQTSGFERGGHAVLLIGWNDSKGAWLLKNSWGATGGPNGDGTFWMAYSGHAQELSFGMANLLAATSDRPYAAEYVTQAPYPENVAPGQDAQWWIEFQNTGTQTWYKTGTPAVRLGTGTSSNPDIVYSGIYHGTWPGTTRAATMVQTSVSPGEVARFTFRFHVPATASSDWSANYNFTPVVEGITWIKDSYGYPLNAFMKFRANGSIPADQYEPNNTENTARTLTASFSNNIAYVTTSNATLHSPPNSDEDYYAIHLASGYNYTVSAKVHDSYASTDGQLYTGDVKYSYKHGSTWAGPYTTQTSQFTVSNGGTIYFKIAPYVSGNVGTYRLDVTITRVATTSYPLTVTKNGTGSGTVTSSPAGISCGSTCTASYTSGTPVTLTATPAAGSAFTGWSGACSGTSACTVTMNSAKNVTATFTLSSYPIPGVDGWDKGSLEGWTGVTSRSSVAIRTSGGNPNGYVHATCQTDSYAVGASTNGIQEYSGNYAAASIKRISVDLRFLSGSFSTAWLRFRYKDASYNGWKYPLTRSFPLNTWKTYTISFDPTWTDSQALAAGWVQESSSPGFRATMADVYTAEIRITGYGIMEADLDNFGLYTTGAENSYILWTK